MYKFLVRKYLTISVGEAITYLTRKHKHPIIDGFTESSLAIASLLFLRLCATKRLLRHF